MDRVLYYDVSLDSSAEINIAINGDDILDYEAQIPGEECVSSSLDSVVRVKATSYNNLTDKPKIEGVTLEGDKSFRSLNLNDITAQDIDEIMFGGD